MEIKYLLAFGCSLVLTLLVMPKLIPFLHKIKFGQSVRKEGPKSHMAKTGTPTMGGIVFVLVPILVMVILNYKAFLTPEMLIGYDMTILVNKYNSYLNWKEKQKILAAEKEHEKTENIVSQAITHGRPVEDHKEESKKSNDINDLLDEIFG